jgi:hypothetical protein
VRQRLTSPSSGPSRFAPFGPPLLSNAVDSLFSGGEKADAEFRFGSKSVCDTTDGAVRELRDSCYPHASATLQP